MRRLHHVGGSGHARDGKPGPEGLCGGDDVGDHVVLLDREQRSGPAHPGLHLVIDEEDVAFLAHRFQRRKVVVGGDDEAAFPLDGLHDHARDVLGPYL